jgi:hypothetical protein
MKEFNFYNYDSDLDKINIYSDELFDFVYSKFNIIVDSIDFDVNNNIVLYIEQMKNINTFKLEKEILNSIEHLNDVEIRNLKIVLIFDCENIEIF